MILVDTSVWVDHLHRAEPELVALLNQDMVVIHDCVIQELALGSIRNRGRFLESLGRLRRAPLLRHDEVMAFVEGQPLRGKGLSVIDAHLLGSARVAGLALWTRDKRLRAASAGLGVSHVEQAGRE